MQRARVRAVDLQGCERSVANDLGKTDAVPHPDGQRAASGCPRERKVPFGIRRLHANGRLSVTLAGREQRVQSRSIGGDLGKVYLGPRCFPQCFVVVRVGVDGPYEVLERVFLAAFLVGGIAQRNELGRRLGRYRRGPDGEGHRARPASVQRFMITGL